MTTSEPDQARRHELTSIHEALLAQSAGEGDAAAYVELYRRYEPRIFNFCLRVVGSPEDAADATRETFLRVFHRLREGQAPLLNVGAHLFSVARSSSAGVLDSQRRAQPPGEVPEEEPLLASFGADVRAASLQLPQRQREALALRELHRLSYDEIADVLETSQHSVAELLYRARITLAKRLRQSSLSAVAASEAECARALPLIGRRGDAEALTPEDRAFLGAHLATCLPCRLSDEAMQEAGATYRAWLPALPLAGLAERVFASIGETAGSAWVQDAREHLAATAGATAGLAGTITGTGSPGVAATAQVGGTGGRAVAAASAAAVAVAALAFALVWDGDATPEPRVIANTPGSTTGPTTGPQSRANAWPPADRDGRRASSPGAPSVPGSDGAVRHESLRGGYLTLGAGAQLELGE